MVDKQIKNFQKLTVIFPFQFFIDFVFWVKEDKVLGKRRHHRATKSAASKASNQFKSYHIEFYSDIQMEFNSTLNRVNYESVLLSSSAIILSLTLAFWAFQSFPGQAKNSKLSNHEYRFLIFQFKYLSVMVLVYRTILLLFYHSPYFASIP